MQSMYIISYIYIHTHIDRCYDMLGFSLQVVRGHGAARPAARASAQLRSNIIDDE